MRFSQRTTIYYVFSSRISSKICKPTSALAKRAARLLSSALLYFCWFLNHPSTHRPAAPRRAPHRSACSSSSLAIEGGFPSTALPALFVSAGSGNYAEGLSRSFLCGESSSSSELQLVGRDDLFQPFSSLQRQQRPAPHHTHNMSASAAPPAPPVPSLGAAGRSFSSVDISFPALAPSSAAPTSASSGDAGHNVVRTVTVRKITNFPDPPASLKVMSRGSSNSVNQAGLDYIRSFSTQSIAAATGSPLPPLQLQPASGSPSGAIGSLLIHPTDQTAAGGGSSNAKSLDSKAASLPTRGRTSAYMHYLNSLTLSGEPKNSRPPGPPLLNRSVSYSPTSSTTPPQLLPSLAPVAAQKRAHLLQGCPGEQLMHTSLPEVSPMSERPPLPPPTRAAAPFVSASAAPAPNFVSSKPASPAAALAAMSSLGRAPGKAPALSSGSRSLSVGANAPASSSPTSAAASPPVASKAASVVAAYRSLVACGGNGDGSAAASPAKSALSSSSSSGGTLTGTPVQKKSVKFADMEAADGVATDDAATSSAAPAAEASNRSAPAAITPAATVTTTPAVITVQQSTITLTSTATSTNKTASCASSSSTTTTSTITTPATAASSSSTSTATTTSVSSLKNTSKSIVARINSIASKANSSSTPPKKEMSFFKPFKR